MKTNKKIVMIILTILILILFFVDKKGNNDYSQAEKGYLVYLDGQEIGLIKNGQELYQKIDKKQQALKNKYNVKEVYPPEGFKLIEVNTFKEDYMPIDKIYQKLENLANFTIKGYTITIKFPEDSGKKPVKINVLDKRVFEEAINKFVTAFIPKEELNDYIAGNKKEIQDLGEIIDTMYFNETITIKENLISVKDKIYTDAQSLTQYLLFGEDAQMTSYTVKLGDDIKSISNDHKLNPQEFIIANPKYRNENTMLQVGTEVNVTILNPVLTFVYEVYKIEETTTRFNNKTVVDKTKDSGYKEITTPGVTGITRNHEKFSVINGERNKEIQILEYEVIREKIDQVTTIGRKPVYYEPPITGGYIPSSGDWGWPTNQPSVITSPYGYRCFRGHCKVHEGIDISGTGFRSPIYATNDGEVVESGRGGKAGNYIVIRHSNNIYSQYAHLEKSYVKVGQKVSQGQQIGEMGNTGYTSGTHLHFGLSVGWPYKEAYSFKNPFYYLGR